MKKYGAAVKINNSTRKKIKNKPKKIKIKKTKL